MFAVHLKNVKLPYIGKKKKSNTEVVTLVLEEQTVFADPLALP